WINQAGQSVLDAPEVKWTLARKSSLRLAGQAMTLAPGESRTITLTAKVDGRLKQWSPDAPNLYGLLLTVSADGKPVDVKYQRFGWRQFTFNENKLLLNGHAITLRGDSWHFLGVPQMTRRYAWAWYHLLKDAGANAVRLHASIYPSFYHDMADEMGIMILDESAIWASDGGPKADSDLFWRNCQTNVTELVRRDRNHPSVFGWSVCNEILPVLRNVWHAPQSMVDHCLDQISVWRDICRTNDPTRPWISGDGEWDAEGRLPVINIHYGGDADMRRAADSGKPWAVGETSMAYYGTPSQVSKFNGNEAYESDLGRMNGLAYECYDLLNGQQKYDADYASVFNIAWYSVQPLPLGKNDVSKPVSLSDGVFFESYREGVPGMQPERLGPYTSTLNPGYDPALPLYRPWPMFDAIRDANTGVTNSPWAHRPDLTQPAPESVLPATATASYLPENGNRLAQELGRCGVKLSVYTNGVRADFLLVDGSIAESPDSSASARTAVNNVLAHGGTVWIWNVTPAGASSVSQLLGHPVSVEPREASSFVVKQDIPLLKGLDNTKFYFSEDDDWRQMDYSLTGAFVAGAQAVLDACPADWRQWNYKPEPVKTAALYRSEVERTAPLTAIAIRPLDKGRVILCNLNPQIRSTKKSELLARLFQNEGIPVGQISAQNEFLDVDGRLIRALVCGSFGVANPHDAYNGMPPTGEIREDAALNNRRWKLVDADSEGTFDFKKVALRGPMENAYAYLAIWVKSPKPLNDLLSEPNLPRVSFTFGSDDGCQVWLNGKLLASHERHGPLEPEAFSINPLLLKLGWNQLVIKVIQAGGEWKFAGKLGCSDVNFLSNLEVAATPPNPK
ncbi:MAG TPA: glycoside hydrolase family 2 TIM barrel-domain containing protein, partial [Candidatus Acidoferrales bacterium]|nr:glycoside hydrolase family 2 TIM barrel-domain containing protein [Candidatus Acidoferrales bacterium]